MASPPTITLGVLNAGTAIPGGTTAYNWDSANLLRTAGEWKQFGAVFPDTLAGRGQTTTFLAGGASDTGYAFAVEFIFTGRYIEPRVLTKGFNWQLMIKNGSAWEYAALPFIASGGGGYRCLIDFGATVTDKHIRIEHQSDGQMGLIEILTESTATVTAAPAYTDRLVIIGDSHTGQSGVTVFRDAASYRVAKELGFGDHRIASSGGTGYLQDNPGVQLNGFDRWTADVVNVSPTMVICLLGSNDVNDGNDAAIASTLPGKLDELRAALPNCLVHVFGPVNGSAPTIPLGHAGCNSAIQSSCVGKPKVWFHDISDVAFTKWDGAHADPAGHVTNYKAWYNKIAAVHGLAPVA